MLDRDFDKMLWHVHKLDLDRDDIFEKIPDINFYDVFKKEVPISKNRVIAYIVYSYDMNSPFVRKYDNVNRRKRYAAKKAGLIGKDGDIGENVESMMSGDNIIINGMILGYCRIQNNDDWGLMQTFREAMYKGEANLLNPKENQREKDIIDNLTKLRKELKELGVKFLVNDKTDGLVYDFHTAIESDDLIPRPEEIARRIQLKEQVLPNWVNPYREGVNG